MRRATLFLLIAAAPALMGSRVDANTDVQSSWSSATSGDWTNAADWTPATAYPNNSAGVGYSATVNATGNPYEITSSGNVTIDSLTLNSPSATLSIKGGTFSIRQSINIASGTLALYGFYPYNNPTLAGGTLSAGPGAIIDLYGAGLSGVTLGSDITASGGIFSNIVPVYNGFNLNGHSMSVEAGADFLSVDDSGINGPGTITVTGHPYSSGYECSFTASGTLRIGSGVVIQTGAISYGESEAIYIGDGPTGNTRNSVLGGTINSWVPGVPVYIKGNWVNNGTISVGNGGIMDLGGSFNTAGMGKIINQGGYLQVVGNWDNTNTTYTLTQPLTLTSDSGSSASVTGGTIIAAGQGSLNVGDATFKNMNLSTPISVGVDATFTCAGTVNLANSVISFAGGSGFNSHGSTWNITDATILGPALIMFNGTTQSSTIAVYNSGQITTIGPGVVLEAVTGGTDFLVGSGGLNFSGTVITGPGVQAIKMGSGINFNGSVSVLSGGTFTAPSVLNFVNGNLSNATYTVNSDATLRLPGANVTTLNASVTLNGSNSNLYSTTNTTTGVLAGLTTIGTQGSLALLGGRNLSLSNSLLNNGTLTLDAGDALSIAGSFSQSQRGSLNYVLGPGSCGVLAIGGSTNLSGGLAVSNASGFTPTLGQSFDLLFLSSAASGGFSTISLPPLEGGLEWDTSQLYTQGIINVISVPEPVGACLIVPAIIGLSHRTKRGRCCSSRSRG